MPSCLLVLIFIYRFSSFSLPFLCTDGTLQLASHSASFLTSPQVNAFHVLLPFFCYNIRHFKTFQYQEGQAVTKSKHRGWTGLGSVTLFKSHKGHLLSLYIIEKELVWIQKAFREKRMPAAIKRFIIEYIHCCMRTQSASWMLMWLISSVGCELCVRRWLNKYIVKSHCVCIRDSVITVRCHEGQDKPNQSRANQTRQSVPQLQA